jgi:hypothetical protein
MQMPPVDPNALAPDVRALIGMPAEEGSCWEDQPVCQPDVRVTAQLVQPEPVEQITPWRIVNAEAGDLLLTPGGPAGFIGAMLGELDPPEFYSHMGIVVEDQVSIRHCTTSEEVLRRYPHKADGPIADASREIAPDSLNESPTDGFQESNLKFQWPGTITQTVEAAFLSARNRGQEAEPHKIRNSDLNMDFRIAALTFKPEPFPTADGKTRLVHPMLVKTCFNPNHSADQHAAIRDAKARVVQAAKDLRCHYRFYSYTRADVGSVPDGPPVLETTELALAPGCWGLMGRDRVPTPATAGAQCASLVWLAVQRANALATAGPVPHARIILDSTTFDSDHVWLCPERSYLPPTRAGSDRILSTGGSTADGLYYYTREERARAGNRLYESLHANVVKQIKESVALQKAFDDATDGDVAKPLLLVYNLLSAGLSFSSIRLLLGVTDEVLRALIRIFSDIPDDLASQLANAFASDDCSLEATDSDAWKENPGIGETVSPDATYRYWSPPVHVSPGELVVGLWGQNVMAGAPMPPIRIKKGPPPSTWQLSGGNGEFIRSGVYFSDPDRDPEDLDSPPTPYELAHPAVGAVARIGCKRIYAGAEGDIPPTQIPEGLYWSEAWWIQPVTGLRYSAVGKAIHVVEGQAATRNFFLAPPPGGLRRVWAHVHMDNVSRKAFDKDWWDHPDWTTEPEWLGADLAEPVLKRTIAGARAIDDWGTSEFELEIELITEAAPEIPLWSLRVRWKIRINEAGEQDPWREKGEQIVPPKGSPGDGGWVFEDNLSRLDFWPVRSHVWIELHNDVG